ncbi:hypothetical protein B0T24DRAFT_268125 [Lasiosphaeria ovina]|uniref:Uncharacterized protein n=1 Tax=Lasiosphaeria ovina TaxID=92902 RepID=A0AAE0KCB9_9PEZI|nr:hypothetical protein B0T24DRAFT_268125 [Lasiosphaeria ovina]
MPGKGPGGHWCFPDREQGRAIRIETPKRQRCCRDGHGMTWANGGPTRPATRASSIVTRQRQRNHARVSLLCWSPRQITLDNGHWTLDIGPTSIEQHCRVHSTAHVSKLSCQSQSAIRRSDTPRYQHPMPANSTYMSSLLLPHTCCPPPTNTDPSSCWLFGPVLQGSFSCKAFWPFESKIRTSDIKMRLGRFVADRASPARSFPCRPRAPVSLAKAIGWEESELGRHWAPIEPLAFFIHHNGKVLG